VSTTEELLQRKGNGSGLENRDYGRKDPSRRPRGTCIRKIVDTNFADKRRLLGRHSSHADSDHGVCCFVCLQHTVLSGESQFPFQMYILLPSSGMKSNVSRKLAACYISICCVVNFSSLTEWGNICSSEMMVDLYHSTQCHMPEVRTPQPRDQPHELKFPDCSLAPCRNILRQRFNHFHEATVHILWHVF
jgi:hypothetical protein